MCICGVIIKFVVVHLNITDAFSFARYFHQLRFVSFCFVLFSKQVFFVLFSLRCAYIAQIPLLRRPNSVLSFEMSIVCIKYIRWFFVCFFLVLCSAQLILVNLLVRVCYCHKRLSIACICQLVCRRWNLIPSKSTQNLHNTFKNTLNNLYWNDNSGPLFPEYSNLAGKFFDCFDVICHFQVITPLWPLAS